MRFLIPLFAALLAAVSGPAAAQVNVPLPFCTPFSGFPLNLILGTQIGTSNNVIGAESVRCSNQKIMTAMNTLSGMRGVANGIATLGPDGTIPINQQSFGQMTFQKLISGVSTITQSTPAAAEFRNSATTGNSVSSPFDPPGGKIYDFMSVVLDYGPGSATTQPNAFGAYVLNRTLFSAYPNANNAVAVYGLGVNGIDGAASWGGNFVCSDRPVNQITTTFSATTRCIGAELDVIANGPSVNDGLLINLLGNGVPSSGIALHIASGNPNRWTAGVVIDDGTVGTGAIFGASAAPGPNVGSQPVAFRYYDPSGAAHAMLLQALGVGSLKIGSDIAGADYMTVVPGAGNISLYALGTGANGNFNLVTRGAGSINLLTSGLVLSYLAGSGNRPACINAAGLVYAGSGSTC